MMKSHASAPVLASYSVGCRFPRWLRRSLRCNATNPLVPSSLIDLRVVEMPHAGLRAARL